MSTNALTLVRNGAAPRLVTEPTPPQNIQAEQAVLGAMLLGDTGAIQQAGEMLRPGDFYRDAHEHIFKAMLHLDERGEPVDAVTLKEELLCRGIYDLIGGASYLMALGDIVPSAANVAYYAKIVQEKAVLRSLIGATAEISARAYGGMDDADALVEDAEARMALAGRSGSRKRVLPVVPAEPPNLHGDALHGLAGDIVRCIAPHTEAAPVAILAQLLTAFGNAIGRGPYFQVGASPHHTNLFACLVGVTSNGRKGTSWDYVSEIMKRVDSEWAESRVLNGTASGEGFISAVRDKEGGDADKRLLVLETEFALLLKVAGREGNTASARLRAAWDTGHLNILRSRDPERATGAHISVIGHITKDELLHCLRGSDTTNGFANRFLWFWVHREQVIAEPTDITQVNLSPLVSCLHDAVEFARYLAHQVWRDEGARNLWCDVYPALTAEVPGALGAVISRSAPQAVRLSLLYALLDQSETIRVEHLRAALAVWKYARESAEYIFGCSIGDPVADEILQALRASEKPLTRTYINHDIFHRHQSARRINEALQKLQDYGLAQCETRKTGGCAAEAWTAT